MESRRTMDWLAPGQFVARTIRRTDNSSHGQFVAWTIRRMDKCIQFVATIRCIDDSSRGYLSKM